MPSLCAMADVQVFVDDAVRGTLPEVCAKDGVPTSDQLRFSDEIGNPTPLGLTWLLILAGPLGWLGIVVISFMRGGRPETLTVQLPLSDTAYARIRGLRRQRAITVAAVVASVLFGLWSLISYDGTAGEAFLWRALGVSSAAAVVMSMIGLAIVNRRITAATVSFTLDASRRWVTLHRVHPQFAAAYRAQEQQRDRQRT